MQTLYGFKRTNVKIQVLYGEGCPHTDPAVDLIHEVARELGVTIDVCKTLVETVGQAKKYMYLGSPTVQINNRDIDPEARGLQFSGFS
jgi:hypothetical protein